MKKYSVCALAATAFLAAAGVMPTVAYAGVNTYDLSGGNGKMIVIGGSNREDLKEALGQIQGGNLFGGCEIVLPGNGNPGAGIPDISLPLPGIPSPDFPDTDIPGQGGTAPDGGVSQDAFASQVVQLVNQERAKMGLSPLTVSSGASGAAQKRAREIETSFSHTRPNGSSPFTALTEAGVNFRGAGENIAYGQKAPEQVMQGWMNSAGHRANILNESFTSIGVGHYRNAAGVDYWTQLFFN